MQPYHLISVYSDFVFDCIALFIVPTSICMYFLRWSFEMLIIILNIYFNGLFDPITFNSQGEDFFRLKKCSAQVPLAKTSEMS